ncbi:MAG: putative zinc-binding metallopeptidase [Planctomycetes bacterium]|nr:putative zinc-binding metallopeptidase [Planctomycetota bacterium]
MAVTTSRNQPATRSGNRATNGATNGHAKVVPNGQVQAKSTGRVQATGNGQATAVDGSPSKVKPKGSSKAKPKGRAKTPDWVTLSGDELLDVRFCDLKIRIEDTPLKKRVERLHEELRMRGLRFRPHCWFSDEWFSPDGIPGIAVPFYLAHPRLAALERKQMLDVEGGTAEWCMRILRHEAGHAFDSAHHLHRRRRWRELFGKYSQKYPEFYQPKPYSKRYVLHLDLWYAQSHPAEDFAETFAVWLKPRSGWRNQYRGWPALKKLQYVDALGNELRGARPKVATRRRAAPLREIRKTLREHYAEKRARYGLDHPDFNNRELRRLFSDQAEHAGNPAAASFLRRIRPELRRLVAFWTGEYRYTIDQVLGDMIDRCSQLKLRLDRPEEQARRDALVMLTVQTMNYLHGGRHRVAL